RGRWTGELGLTRVDGEPFLAQGSGSLVLNEDGRPIAMVGVMYDITKLRRKDEQLKVLAIEKIATDEANRAKTIFLANMSHELRTPLTAVLASASMLLEGLFGKLNKKQVEYVNNVQDGARHLLNIINDILDMSKVESGKMELQAESAGVAELLDSVLVLYRESAARSGLRLVKHFELPKGFQWAVDKRKIKQVLMNLLANAIKFTQKGGKVELQARLITAQALPPRAKEAVSKLAPEAKEFLLVALCDTGIGIRPEDMNKLF
ncbi:MAG TPA: histidine kinase dimerization/phospho-acceptor domain-containing protein, partial [Elusimicrobiales bacterium]|nr:histidine kinase dimerization/phospho-acceptor domain-containing protein [Elusimicrobiales bacterium]